MYTQKLYKNGNSIVVSIPKEYLKDLGLRDGTPVAVRQKGSELIVTHRKKKPKTGGVNAKFMKMVDEFINSHEDVLQELAGK